MNKNKKTLKEHLSEKKLVSRWVIIVSTMTGALAGAVLMFLVMILGLIT